MQLKMENSGYSHIHNRCPKSYLVLLRDESYPRAISGSVNDSSIVFNVLFTNVLWFERYNLIYFRLYRFFMLKYLVVSFFLLYYSNI